MGDVVPVEEILNTTNTFFTAAGTFTGMVVEVTKLEYGYAYSLIHVIFRPTGNFKMQISIPDCAIYSRNVIATTLSIEPVTFENAVD